MIDHTSDAHPFTWKHYREILSAGLESGYNFVRFCDDPRFNESCSSRSEKRIYLRHDIENDIGAANTMASIEHTAGVAATYFVLLRSPNYNPAERRNVNMIEEMYDMGHDIGLHFSLIDHPEINRDHRLQDLIRKDADILASILARDIKVFSFHNPPPDGRYSVPVSGLINTYADKYFRKAYYTSDSNVCWNSGCPCQVLREAHHEVVQLLIHPNAFPANFTTDREVLLHFIGQKVDDLLTYNVHNNRVLQASGLPITDALEWIKTMDTSL